MPEGDAVWRTARRLHQGLVGQTLIGADLRVPALATRDLTGRRTLEVVPRGKHLLHRLEGDVTLHSHLRMDGSWRVTKAARPPRSADRHTVRAVLWTGEVVAVGDSLGMLDLVRTSEEHTVVGHLGPDLLDPAFDREQALTNLLAEPDRPVAEALLDQRNLAGIGTIFASEPLFAAAINPWAPVAAVGRERLGELVDHTRRQLVLSCRLGRTATIGASEKTSVYRRVGRGCLRCGATIQQGAVGQQPQQRVFSWCPGCQVEPAGPAEDARTDRHTDSL